MDNPTAEEKQQAIEAIRSIIRKSEKALAHMKPEAGQTKRLEKRRMAARLGLDTLLAIWEGQTLTVSKAKLLEAKLELEDLLATLPSFLNKQKEGSGQRTYMTRRIEALQAAVSCMDDWMDKSE